MAAYGVTGLLIGLLMLAVAFGIGLPLLAGQAGPDLTSSDLLEVGGGGVLSVALSAMLGVGIGVLVRNQVAAVVGTLVWFFIVEPLVTLVSDEAYKYSISQSASAVAGTQGGDYLSFGLAVLVLAGWAAVFVALGAFVDGRRDVT
jgi:hypothetical protein